MKERITLENVTEHFFTSFPELLNHRVLAGDDYSETPYFLFGVIAMNLSVESHKNKLNEKESLGIVKWVNDLWNDSSVSEKVKDMFWIEFFENINSNEYKNYLMKNFTHRANLNLRQYLYIIENGGLTDVKTREILKYKGKNIEPERTGKYIDDIR